MRFVLLCILLASGSMTPVYGQHPKAITNSIGMKLVLIHPGFFTMGSPDGEIGRQQDETAHEVTISKSYYLGVYEVTQEQYERVTGENPSEFKEAKHPVNMVNWHDAVSFCTKLSGMPAEKTGGRVYRLPTEAEWEYACRSTSTTSYGFGDTSESFDEYCWSEENSDGKTHPAGEKKANRRGLHDMHGNVFEWCQDEYLRDPAIGMADPKKSIQDTFRVLRGGGWTAGVSHCRSASRWGPTWKLSTPAIGFRAAMSLPSKESEPEAAPSK